MADPVTPNIHRFSFNMIVLIHISIAISEMNRTFVIPASETSSELKIDIREPGIVEDNLGLKTWGTAHALAKILEEIGKKYFYHLLHIDTNAQRITMHNGYDFARVKSRVLELGAGTGLVGIVASKLVRILLTSISFAACELYNFCWC